MVPPTKRGPDCRVTRGGDPPRRRQRASLWLKRPSNMSTSVAIVKLPDEFSNDLQKIMRSGDESLEVKTAASPSDDLRTRGTLALHWTKQESSKSQDGYEQSRYRQYNGLHVDNWDQLDLEFAAPRDQSHLRQHRTERPLFPVSAAFADGHCTRAVGGNGT